MRLLDREQEIAVLDESMADGLAMIRWLGDGVVSGRSLVAIEFLKLAVHGDPEGVSL